MIMILNMYIIVVDEMGKIKQITGNNITTYAYVYDNNLIKNQLIQHYHHWPQKYKIQTNRTSKNMANHLRIGNGLLTKK